MQCHFFLRTLKFRNMMGAQNNLCKGAIVNQSPAYQKIFMWIKVRVGKICASNWVGIWTVNYKKYDENKFEHELVRMTHWREEEEAVGFKTNVKSPTWKMPGPTHSGNRGRRSETCSGRRFGPRTTPIRSIRFTQPTRDRIFAPTAKVKILTYSEYRFHLIIRVFSSERNEGA